MDVVRITELQPKTYVEQGDYIAIDNQSDGTKKVQFTNLLDDTLSQENKIAPANVVGDKIATVRDTMEDEIATIRAAVGSPLKASTVAQMTDKNKIYVYVGSESGYTNGNWYYWNGSAWTSGGVYNSVAVVTDPTLTLSGVPADAKVTGDEIGNLKSDLNAEILRENLFTGWKQGYYASVNGEYEPNHNNYVCTISPIPLTFYDILYWNLDRVIENSIISTAALYLNAYDAEMAYIGSWQFGTIFSEVISPSRWSPIANIAFANFSFGSYSGSITPSTVPPLEIYRSALGTGNILKNAVMHTAPLFLDLSNFIYDVSEGGFVLYFNRLGMRNVAIAEADKIISVSSGYKYAVFRFTSTEPSSSTFISNTGWLTTPSTISKGEMFLINMALESDDNLIPTESVINALTIRSLSIDDVVPVEMETAFRKGVFDANGNIDSITNGVYTASYTLNPMTVNIGENARAVLLLYSNGQYIGKVNSTGQIDKVSGDWMWFTKGTTDVSEYLEKAGANVIRLAILPTDDTTITSDNAQSWGEAHCTIIAGTIPTIKYLEDNYVKKTTSIKNNYVLGADLMKKYVNVDFLGSLTYLQAFCIYDGKYYSIDGANIAEQDGSFNVLRNTSLNTGHGNGLQLGNGKYAYASGWNDNNIYKVDLENLTIADTIALPTTGYTTGVVDEVKNLAYIFQRDSLPDHEDNYNFIVYDITNQQILSTKKILAFGAMQACDLLNDRIIVLNGLGNSACPNGYRVFDTNGNILAEYRIGDFSTTEPEGVCIDRDTHELYMSTVNRSLYKITG